MPRPALFLEAIVAADSSKLKAVNSRDRNFTPGKVEARPRQIDESIQRHLRALDTADRTGRLREENEVLIRTSWSGACPGRPPKRQCTTSEYRRVRHWEQEQVLDAMQRRLDRQTRAMMLRRRTIGHVFGTLEHWMGATCFLTRGLEHVGT